MVDLLSYNSTFDSIKTVESISHSLSFLARSLSLHCNCFQSQERYMAITNIPQSKPVAEAGGNVSQTAPRNGLEMPPPSPIPDAALSYRDTNLASTYSGYVSRKNRAEVVRTDNLGRTR